MDFNGGWELQKGGQTSTGGAFLAGTGDAEGGPARAEEVRSSWCHQQWGAEQCFPLRLSLRTHCVAM